MLMPQYAARATEEALYGRRAVTITTAKGVRWTFLLTFRYYIIMHLLWQLAVYSLAIASEKHLAVAASQPTQSSGHQRVPSELPEFQTTLVLLHMLT